MEGVTVGVLSPYLAGSYFGALIDAIARVVWQAGGRVVSVQTARPGMELREGHAAKTPARVGWDHIGGFVVIGDATPPGYVAELERAGKAVVTVAHEEPGVSCPVVVVDNRGGIKAAVEHLLRHGHRRIAFAGCMDMHDVRERYESYRCTLSAHGAGPDRALLFAASDNVEFGGLEAGRSMVAAGLPSTAVVAATDLNALGVMKVLRDAGLSLPADQAVTGFDNGVGSELMIPALSTATHDIGRVGAKAAELLLRRLGGGEVRGGRHVVEAPFVVRESCGCDAGTGDWPTGAALKYSRDPVRGFCQALGELSWAPPEGGAASLARLAEDVAGVLAGAGEREPTASDLERLGRACEELYGGSPSQSTADLVSAFADRLAGQVEEDRAGRREVARRLVECRARVRLGLARAALRERTDAYYAMRRAVREEYLITMDLLAGRQDGDPRGLGWLGRTEALAAVLGLWEGGWEGRWEGATATALGGAGGVLAALEAGGDAPARAASPGPSPSSSAGLAGNGRRLHLASSFKAGGTSVGLEGASCKEESFPPEELLGTVEEGRVAAVIPISSEQADWGLLAMVGPAGPACIGQDMYFMWAALFAEVLDRQALTSSLLLSEERYALAARASNDGLWDWDLASDRVYYSDRWREMLGCADGAVGDGPDEWLGRVHPEDRPRLSAQLSDLRQGSCDKAVFEHRVRAEDGSYVWALCRALAVPGGGAPAARLVGSLTDVTERYVLEEQLRRQALYDSLTGLPNRVLFMDHLSQALAAAKRRRRPSFAVLWLDLDNFKDLNDKKGHLAGDELLVQVAGRVRANLRAADTAARFGGDEFAVLLVDVTGPTVLDISRRLLSDLGKPYRVEDEEFVVTASAGVVMGNGAYERPEEVLRDADIAMYQAKSADGGGFVRFSPLLARPA